MSETIEDRYERYITKPDSGAENDSREALDLIRDLMTEREKMKGLREDRYEFPVNEWNEQLIQTINDTGCPAKIVLTRRKQSKGKED